MSCRAPALGWMLALLLTLAALPYSYGTNGTIPNTPSCNVTGSILPEITYMAPIMTTSQGTIRSSISAFVTVCENGQYGAICSNGFDFLPSIILCQDIVNLNYPGAYVLHAFPLFYTNNTVPIVRQNVSCFPGQGSFSDCSYSSNIDDSCLNPAMAVGVQCSFEVGNGTGTSSPETPSQFCNEGQVLPFDYVQVSPSTFRMLPVLCLNGIPGSICSVGFDDQDASVVCNAIGVSLNLTALGGRAINNIFNFTLGPVLFQDLNCTGYETNLEQCQFQTNVSTLCMNDRSYTAGVECYYEVREVCQFGNVVFPNLTTINTQLDSSNTLIYTVEALPQVCLPDRTSFGGICDRGLGSAEAAVVCRLLAYQFQSYTGSDVNVKGSEVINYGNSDYPIALQDLKCHGQEFSLTMCNASFTIDSECSNVSRAAGFRCMLAVVPSGSGSGNGSAVCNDGDLQAEQSIAGLTFLTAEGKLLSNTSFLLTTCVSGSYGGVCRRGIDDTDVKLACTHLGYNYGGEVAMNQSNYYTGPIYIQDVNCTGSETHPSQCGVNMNLTADCFSSSSIVRINCFSDSSFPCDDSGILYPVQTATSTSYSLLPGGRVENSYTTQLAYCVNGTNYGICQSNFYDSAALVACRSFAQFIPGLTITRAEAIYNGYSDNKAPLYFQDVSCTGNEVSYADCNASLVTDAFCMNTSNAVGVRCYFEISFPGNGSGSGVCNDGDLRPALEPVFSRTDNNLLIVSLLLTACVSGSFGGICHRGFDNLDATLACRNLNFEFPVVYGEVAINQSNNYTGPIFIQDVNCTGQELHPNQCGVNTDLTSDCMQSNSIVKINCVLNDFGGGSGFGNTSIPSGPVLPFGGEVGDIILPPGCNLYSDPISLSPPFIYFGQPLSTLYINSNGYLSFEEIFTFCCPTYFPTRSPPIIAVLWHGYNTSRFGREDGVSYRFTRDSETLANISTFITATYMPFIPSYAVVITWNMVPSDNISDSSLYTFQAILTSNGSVSFVAFAYGSLDGLRNVQVGFNLGDDYTYDQIFSNRYFYAPVDIHTGSNIQETGVYLYRVDNLNSDFGPTATPTPTFSPPVMECYDGEYRLLTVYSNTTSKRNLEFFTEYLFVPLFCQNGRFGYICDSGWNDAAARQLCRRGPTSPYTYEAVHGVMLNSSFPSVNYTIQDVNCSGPYIYDLNSCRYNTANNSVCGVGEYSSIAGVICREIPPTCFDGEIRVRNQTYGFERTSYRTISGRVEVCHNGSYIAVCSGGLGQIEAEIACARLSYRQPYYTSSIIQLQGWPGDVLSSVNCDGNQAQFYGDFQPCGRVAGFCSDSSQVAGVVCKEVLGECYSNGDLRYTNINTISNSSGSFTTAHVEVCYNRTYGSVCDKYVTQEDAQALCRDRFSSPIGQVIPSPAPLDRRPHIVLERIDGCETYSCYGAMFGVNDSDCMNNSHAVGVSCSRTCSDGDTRIIGPRYYEGIVEVCRNNEWGVICDYGWNHASAAVVCQENYFGARGSVATVGLSSTRPILASNVTCNPLYNYALYTCLNCTIIPSGCSSETLAGVRCQPGVVIVDIVPKDEPRYNSPFSLRCNGAHRPFNATLDSYQWTVPSGLFSSDSRRTSSVLTFGNYTGYKLVLFNTTLNFEALLVEDTGIYNCSMTIELTYPDNSTATITNTSYYILKMEVPPPVITFDATHEPFVIGERLQVSCLVSTVNGLTPNDVNITWYSSDGELIVTSGTVTVGNVEAVNATLFSRSVVISKLAETDSGYYSCQARIKGEYVYSDESIVTGELVVERAGPVLPFGQEVGDRILSPGCSQYSDPIVLSPPFIYFGQPLTTLYINSNGYLSFEDIYTYCCPTYFPTRSPPLIAVLWHGYNTSRFGREDAVTYRLTRDPETLANISAFISLNSIPFTPSYAVVITWYRVPSEDIYDSSLYTFQAILASNGSVSFVGLAYGRVDGLQDVQVGFNLGDDYTYDNIISNRYLYSQVDIHNGTNTEETGVYLYRVDNLYSIFGPTATPPNPTVTPPQMECYYDGEIRLLTIDSNTTSNRNLESFTDYLFVPLFCQNGSLGYICDSGWDDAAAEQVCRRGPTSYPFTYEAVRGVMLNSSFPSVSYTIQDVNCSGPHVYDFNRCRYNTANNSVCGVREYSSVAGVICREMPPTCYEGNIRVRNLTYDYGRTSYRTVSGRVEVCHNGSYIAVCSGGLGQMEAEIACASLRYHPPYFTSETTQLSGWPGDVLSSVDCGTNQTHYGYGQCTRQMVSCNDPTQVAGVVCTEVLKECYSNGEVRYVEVGAVFNSSGSFLVTRIEVCFNGTYGSVCDKYVTQKDAENICRDRFRYPIAQVIVSPDPLGRRLPVVLERYDTCDSLYYCGGATFGVSDSDCMNSSRAVGILCSRTCYDGETRIIGSTYYEGIVEICRNNEWGVICDQGWNDASAAVVCQEQDFGVAGSVATFGLSSIRPIFSSNVTCNPLYNSELHTCLNCTIIPDSCSSETLAGVRCQPGVVIVDIVPNDEPQYNSPFSLRCNGAHRPFNATLDSYQWTDPSGLFTSDSRRTSSVLTFANYTEYDLVVFNTTLNFETLLVGDTGIYNCSMTIELTYPDNSTATITNTSYYVLELEVPPPAITIQTTLGPHVVGEMLQMLCLANTVGGLTAKDVDITWHSSDGQLITSDGRVMVGSVIAVNTTLFSRTVYIMGLVGTDSGNYTCQARVSKKYVFSDEASATGELIVEGVPETATVPVIEVLVAQNRTLLEGSTVTFMISINATPPVNISDIRWLYLQDATSSPQDISTSSMLGDGQTQLELSSDRLSLTLRNVSTRSSGTYTVVATNVAGSTQNFFVIDVQTHPEVSLQPPEPVILNSVTDTFTFVRTCTAYGIPTPLVSWTSSNEEIQSHLLDVMSTSLRITYNESGNMNVSVITIMDLTVSQQGSSVTCSVSNAVGNTSATQTLYIAVRGEPTLNSSNLNPTEKEILTITCSSSPSFPQPVFRWSIDGIELRNSTFVTISTNHQVQAESGAYVSTSILTNSRVELSDSGTYSCRLIQEDTSLTVPLPLAASLAISVERFDDCATTGQPRCLNGGECLDGDETYFCKCIGTFEGVNCETDTSLRPPSIISGPQSGSFAVGSRVNLSCIVEGVPTPSVTWLFDGQPDSNLPSLPNITVVASPQRRGQYACLAENSQGSITSVPASIEINDIQQYEATLAFSSRRRRRQTTSSVLQDIVASTVGAAVGNMGVVIYSAVITRETSSTAIVLFTLQRPPGVQFSSGVVNALTSTITSASSSISVGRIVRFDACPDDMIGEYNWPLTDLVPGSIQVFVSCPCRSVKADTLQFARASRVCGGNFVDGATWETPDTTSCNFDEYTRMICNTPQNELLNVVSTAETPTSVESVDITLGIVENIQSENITSEIIDDVADVVNKLLDAGDSEVLSESLEKNNVSFASRLFDVIDNLGESITEVMDMPIRITRANFDLMAESVSRSNLPGKEFSVKPGSPVVEFPDEITQFLPEDVSLVLANIDSSAIGSGSRSGVVISGTLFSVSTGDTKISGLSVPIKLVFPKGNVNDNPIECVFWDTVLRNGLGDWSSAGCSIETTGDTTCSCTHLSTFGVLNGDPITSPSPSPTTAAEVIDEFEVSIIIYIALPISVILLSIIIITYAIPRKLRKQSQIIFINCFLIALYVAFILSSMAKQLEKYSTDGDRVCCLFSAFIQYCMLVYLLSTAVEAISLVWMARTQKDYNLPKKFFIISMLICILLPFVIVGISLGGYQYFLNSNFCRPTNWPFYFGFVAPFIIIMLFDWLLYVVVVAFMKSRSKTLNIEFKKFLQNYVFVAAILSLVFAIAWVFALIGTSSISRNVLIAAQYIFSIMAIIHSIMTFVMHVLRSQEAKDKWLSIWYTITCRSGEFTPSRSYVTAGGQQGGGDELHSFYVPPNIAPDGEEDIAPLSPKQEKTVENVYTMEPGAPEVAESKVTVVESKMMVDDEEVKVNLGTEDDDEENVATAL